MSSKVLVYRVKFSNFEIAFFESLLFSYSKRYTEEERAVYDVSLFLSIFSLFKSIQQLYRAMFDCPNAGRCQAIVLVRMQIANSIYQSSTVKEMFHAEESAEVQNSIAVLIYWCAFVDFFRKIATGN